MLHPEHPRYNDVTYDEPPQPEPHDDAYERALYWAEQDAAYERLHEAGLNTTD